VTDWAKWLNTAPKDKIKLVIRATKAWGPRTSDVEILEWLMSEDECDQAPTFEDLCVEEPALCLIQPPPEKGEE